MAQIFKFDPHLNQSAGIWHNPKPCIGKSPFFWKSWFLKGISVLGDLYDNNDLKSFEKLTREFNIPRQDFWKYLQLRHLLAKTFGSPTVAPPRCGTLEDLREAFGRGHEASLYHKMLLSASDPHVLSLKKTWDTDLNVCFTKKEWKGILKNVKRMSRELRTRLVQFKIRNRVYWTPSRLHKVGLADTSVCWKCHKDSGTLLDMLWECPKVRELWSSVHTVVERLAAQGIPFTNRIYVLGDPSVLNYLPTSLSQ